MTDVVGVELSRSVVRAVALGQWRSAPRKLVEMEWDPSRPEELVGLLREQLGPTRRIALSLGLGFLHLKHVNLPPAPAAERRRILMLEPDRFFPVQGQPIVASLANQNDHAFAVEQELLEQWTLAFEQWAPVESIEAAPLSLARELGRTDGQGTYIVPAGPDESGLLELEDGRVISARRVPGKSKAPTARPLPTRGSVPGDFLCALGAARGVDGALDAMLLPDPLAERIRARRVRRLSLTAAACVVALGIALWALDRSRDRALEQIREQLVVLEQAAEQAVELRDRLGAMERESAAVRQLAGRRPNPLRVLATLSEQLPAGVTVLNVKASGDNWQIDGTAGDAAAIVPLLSRDNQFEDVRFLSASARFRDGNRTYETFSIAFRVRPGD